MENDQRFNKIEMAIATMAGLAELLEKRLNQVQNTIDVDKADRASFERELGGKMSALVDAQIRTESQVARLENAFVTFAEFARAMDERMDSGDRRLDRFDEEMATITGKIDALVDSQIRTDAQLAELRRSQAETFESIKELRRSQAGTFESIKELRGSQVETLESIKELSRSQVRSDDRLHELTHNVDRHITGNGHEHSS